MALLDQIKTQFDHFVDDMFISEEVRNQLNEAKDLLESESYERAIEILEALRDSHPDLYRTEFLIGICYFEKGVYEPALSAFEQAIELRERAPALLYASKCARKLNNWSKAKDLLIKALSINPETTPENQLLGELGELYLESGEPELADYTFEQIPDKLSSKQIETSSARAKLESGDPEAALSAVVPPNSIQQRKIAGLALLEAGDHQRAHSELIHVLENEPENPDIRLKAAECGLEIGEYNRTFSLLDERCFEGADELQKRRRLVLLGDLLMAQGQPGQAEDKYRAAIEIDETPDVFVQIAESQVLRNQFGEALKTLDQIHFAPVPDLETCERISALRGICLFETSPRLLSGHYLYRSNKASDHLKLARANFASRLNRDGLARKILRSLPESDRKSRLLSRISYPGASPELSASPEQLEAKIRTKLTERLQNPEDSKLFDIYDHLKSPLNVIFTGEFNAGKTSIINELIGDTYLPVGPTPETAHPYVVEYGDEASLRLRTTDRSYDLPLEKHPVLSEYEGVVEQLELKVTTPLFQQIKLVDTPGFNAADDSDVDVTKLMGRADLIVWVFDATQSLSQTEMSRIEEIADADQRLLILVNKIDHLPSKTELSELFDYIEQNLDSNFLNLIGTSPPRQGLHTANRVQLNHPLMSHPALRRYFYDKILPRKQGLKEKTTQRFLDQFRFHEEDGDTADEKDYGSAVETLTEHLEAFRKDSDLKQIPSEESDRIKDQAVFALESLKKDIEQLRWLSAAVPSSNPEAVIQDLISKRMHHVLARSRQRVESKTMEAHRDFVSELEAVCSLDDYPEGTSLFTQSRQFGEAIQSSFENLHIKVYERFSSRLITELETRFDEADRPILEHSSKSLHRLVEATILSLSDEFKLQLSDWLETYTTTFERVGSAIIEDFEERVYQHQRGHQ